MTESGEFSSDEFSSDEFSSDEFSRMSSVRMSPVLVLSRDVGGSPKTGRKQQALDIFPILAKMAPVERRESLNHTMRTRSITQTISRWGP